MTYLSQNLKHNDACKFLQNKYYAALKQCNIPIF